MTNLPNLLRTCALSMVISALYGAIPTSAQQQGEILRALESAASEERRQAIIRKERDQGSQGQRKQVTGYEADELDLLEKDNGNCISISSIEVDGVSVFRIREIRDAVKSYEGQCLGKSDMNNILRELTNLYVKKGYITSRVYIPRDNFSNGVFRVVVLEGFLDAIRSPGGTERKYSNIFPGMKDKVLSIRDVEQGLEQMNRLGTVKAKSDIEPGKSKGKSTLVINEKYERRLQGAFGIDNSGSESTGEYLATIGLTIDNLLGLYDVASLNLRFNPDIDRDEKSNVDFSGSYDIPYGYSNFIVSGRINGTTSIINGAVSDFQVKNRNWYASVAWKRMWYRDAKSRISTKVAWNWKSKETYINDSVVQIGTYDRYFASFNVDYSNILEAGVLSLGAGVDVGINTEIEYHNNGVAIPLPDSFPDENYLKLSGSVGWQMPVEFLKQSALLDVSLKGQYSNSILFGEDLFQIGGAGTVQGYESFSLAYKAGVNFRSKLTLVGMGEYLPFKSMPYVGLDFGHVFNPVNTFDDNSLSSFSAGFTSRFVDGLTLNVDFGMALTYPKYFAERDQSLRVRFTKSF